MRLYSSQKRNGISHVYFLMVGLVFSCVFLVPSAMADSSISMSEKLAKIDSANASDQADVEQLIREAKGDDKVRAQLKLVNIFRKSAQIDKADALIKQLNANNEKVSDELKIEITINSALLERKKNNYKLAASILLEKALPKLKSDSPKLARVYQLIGSFYRLNRDMKDAEKYFFLALERYQAVNNRVEIARMYSSLGVFYESLDNLPLAAEYQIKAMKFFEKSNDIEDLASNYFNLGEIYYKSEEYDKSLGFYQKALEFDTKLNDTEFVGYDYHRIGSVYMKQGKIDEAIDYTQKAIEIFSNGAFYQVLSRSQLQLAELYSKASKHKARFVELQAAKENALESGVEHQIRAVWFGLAKYYLDHDEFSQALEYSKKSHTISKKFDLLNYQLDDNELLSNIYQELQQDSDALKHLQEAYKLNQQVNSEQRIKEVEKHKRDINLLEEQITVAKLKESSQQTELEVIEKQKTIEHITLLFIFLLIVFAFVYYILCQRRRMAIISSRLHEEALQQKNQLLADVSHELRTPLTVLKLEVDSLRMNFVDDVDKCYRKLGSQIDDLSNLIGDIYELAVADVKGLSMNCEKTDVTKLLTEWNLEFKKYVNSQGLDWTDSLSFNSAYIDIDKARLKQVLLNVVCNSAKYTDKPGQVELSAKLSDKELILRIQDSAPSVQESDLSRIFERLYRVEKSRNRATGGSGLGLAISQNIVKAHGGTIYARKSKLGGLSVYIRLPLV